MTYLVKSPSGETYITEDVSNALSEFDLRLGQKWGFDQRAAMVLNKAMNDAPAGHPGVWSYEDVVLVAS